MTPGIYKIEASGEEVQKIITSKLVPAIDGQELGHAFIALLTLSVLLIKPNVEANQLKECVMGVSSYIITHLSGIEGNIGAIN